VVEAALEKQPDQAADAQVAHPPRRPERAYLQLTTNEVSASGAPRGAQQLYPPVHAGAVLRKTMSLTHRLFDGSCNEVITGKRDRAASNTTSSGIARVETSAPPNAAAP
jgi:hypothetical protein